MDLQKHADHAALVGRLFYSSLFIVYGYFKITAFAGTTGYMASKGLPAPTVAAALAVIFELGGGLLMLVGYQTRLVALLLAIYVLVAALIAHTHFADGNQMSHFFKNMAIVGGSLAFVAFGRRPLFARRTKIDGAELGALSAKQNARLKSRASRENLVGSSACRRWRRGRRTLPPLQRRRRPGWRR